MRMASSLLCVMVLSIIVFITDQSHGFRAIRTRRPHLSGHLNPLTRAAVDDAGASFGRQFRRSFRDDDDLQNDYFRFLLGDPAERKRRSTSSDHFVPDYYDFMMGDEELKEKRQGIGSTKPDYWDFVSGNTFRQKSEAAEALHNLLRKKIKTAVDGEGMGFPADESA